MTLRPDSSDQPVTRERASPQDRPLVMMIGGPTASAKSALAAAVAAESNATDINADSMQVYRELCLLTARPRGAELKAVPHRLYGSLSGAEACSAGRWRDLAVAEVEAALGEGRLPILAGGTGLYLKAFAEGLNEIPAVPAELRAAARAELAEMGNAAFHARLAGRGQRHMPPRSRDAVALGCDADDRFGFAHSALE